MHVLSAHTEKTFIVTFYYHKMDFAMTKTTKTTEIARIIHAMIEWMVCDLRRLQAHSYELRQSTETNQNVAEFLLLLLSLMSQSRK